MDAKLRFLLASQGYTFETLEFANRLLDTWVPFVYGLREEFGVALFVSLSATTEMVPFTFLRGGGRRRSSLHRVGTRCVKGSRLSGGMGFARGASLGTIDERFRRIWRLMISSVVPTKI